MLVFLKNNYVLFLASVPEIVMVFYCLLSWFCFYQVWLDFDGFWVQISTFFFSQVKDTELANGKQWKKGETKDK